MNEENNKSQIAVWILSILLVFLVIWCKNNSEERITNYMGTTQGEICSIDKFDGGGKDITYKYKVGNREFYESALVPIDICDNPHDCIGIKFIVEYQISKPSNSRIIINGIRY
jgi:hypothetical protein